MRETQLHQRTDADPSTLSPLKRAFLALDRAEQKIAALEQGEREPIAVIGLGCRVPGAENPAAFWQLLRDGVDAVSKVPTDRFDVDALYDPDPDAPGHIATKSGGFLRNVDQFDSAFFGISPREARGMDPQQRLILEVSWEALEHAGQAPGRLDHSKTGVYFGVCSFDYSNLQIASRDYALLDSHYGSGIAHSVVTGRLSYLLGLQGPSISVDTACSSSLVAVHLACQALRQGDCQMALAGGVNLILGPELFVALSHARFLAPDGRCKTFSADADGFGRGEGCGVVVLKTLRQAKAAGDRVLAVIRASALNQDGPSSSLSAPNGPAQQALMRSALKSAGLEPRDVGFIEAHGTGTRLGDPLEVQALGAVFGRDRDPASPLFIGSVKTNVGHLEAAAGVTGLIKLVLALQNREIPPHLHFTAPSPFIDWADLPIRIPTAVTAWEPISGRRIGAVSSFGFSGTNAYVLVEEAPTEPDLPSHAARAHLFAVSARNERALSELAAASATAVTQHTDQALSDLCHTANVGRSHFAVRATVIARTISELSTRLAALSSGDKASGLHKGTVTSRDPPRVAFLFSGQGSQYVGMARGLYNVAPVFREAFDRCAAVLDRHLTQPLAQVVFGGADGTMLDSTAYTQPALFAVEYALTELWRSFGVTPAIVAGHSVGEFVAATVAGVFRLEDALYLVARRGALMASLPAGGAMAAIAASEAEISESIAAFRAELSIAAVNGPKQVVVSGSVAAVEAVTAGFAARGIRCQRLPVSHAFHSPLMEPVLDAFEHELQALKMATPTIHLISNLTGKVADQAEVTGSRYWRSHLRNAVRFADCLNAIAALSPDCIIEIGPQQTLLALCAPNDEVLRVPSLRKGRDDWEQMLDSVGSLFLRGCDIDWRGADNGEQCRVVDLPTYPFQRQRHWLKMRPRAETKVPARPDLLADVHPLLGSRLSSPLSQAQFESRLSASGPAFIGDHRIEETVLLPGTASVEMARAAGAAMFGADLSIEDLVLREAMVFADDGARVVQTIVDPLANGTAGFQIQSRPEQADGPWTLHFQGRLRPEPVPATQVGASQDIAQIAARCTSDVPVDELYALLKQQGVAFGPHFRVLREVKRGTREALSRIQIPEEVGSKVGVYGIHPVLLDGCLQTVVACLYPDADPASLYLPVGIRKLRIWSALGDAGICHVVLQEAGASAGAAAVITVSLRLYDPEGKLAVELDGLEFQRVAVSTRRRLAGHSKGAFYERVWDLKPGAPAIAATAKSAGEPCWVVIGEGDGIGKAVVSALETRGERCLLVDASGWTRSRPAGSNKESAAALLRTWRETIGGLTGILDLRWLEWPADANQCSAQIETVLQERVTETLGLVEALASDAVAPSPRLWLVTRGAQPAGEAGVPVSLWPSAAWGLAWSVALERPQLRTVCIDLDPAADPDEIPALLAEIDQDGSESQVAVRGGQRWLARLQRLENHSRLSATAGMALRAGETYRLLSPRQGSLEELCLAPADRRHPKQGEVEIEVEATGLNFRDVLEVLGLYPGDPGPLGGECAGVVVKVGAGVQGLREGDRVIAMAAGSFARHVVARQELVRPLPRGVTTIEGAAIPIAYLTAGYALEQLAQIKASDRVLIHAAAGGVGLAAVQLALRAGAEVFATAGSATKRARLRAMGIRHVLDSRNPSFADAILAATGGQGVDVVLNSLSGAMMEATFRVTARGARFVEIGKRGVWTHAQVSRLGRDIAYHLVDLGEVAEQQPDLIGNLFTRLVADISNGALPTPSTTVFPLDAASAAFRHMMQARQIGKIVLIHEPMRTPAPLVHPEGTYLITGGNSGLGLFAAEWLVGRGARHLVLVGRRGATAESLAAVARMRAAGASVATASVDVGDATALGTLLERLRDEGPPLRGILHAAGVIDDAELGEQDWSRFERVLRPKALGVLNLDRLTRQDPLDWFVLFSSAASVLGSPGQANYAAANTVLDSVAHERRRLGRPALSVNWGPWSEIGLAAGAFTTERLAASGISPMTPKEAVNALEEVMSTTPIQVGVVDANWSQLIKKREATGVSPSYFAKLAHAGGERRQAIPGASQTQSVTIRERLAAAAPKRRPLLLRDFVRSATIGVLGWDESRTLGNDAPLTEAGLDSLLSVELRNVLSRSLGLSLPATLLFDHPTIASLERCLLTELRYAEDDGKSETVRSGAPEPPSGSVVLAEIAELSDEEVERLVAGKQR